MPAILALVWSGCASSNPVPLAVPPTLPPPPLETAPPVGSVPQFQPTPASFIPSPQPTALPAPYVSLSLPPWPLTGPPPFTASLSADLYGDLLQTAPCQSVHWEFGDQGSETQPCPAGAEQPYRLQARHTYVKAGTYHPRVRVRLSNGQEVESNTQTLVVAVPQPVFPTQEALRWALWGLSLSGAAVLGVWLRRQAGPIKVVGYGLLALSLITFVPPFSYLPNPLGLYWAWNGSYHYDPRLPFVNRFVIAGDPTSVLRPFLDGLIGQTGLNPLDPARPLARYEFVGVSFSELYRVVQVETRLTYEGGAQRTYLIPLYQDSDIFGFYRANWRYDGLGRLRTEHRELPGTPFATSERQIHLGLPQRLSLHPDAEQLDAANPANWGPMGSPWQHLVWSPQGDAFLAVRWATYEQRDLWLVKLNGSPPLRIAQDVDGYHWSPDGRFIVFTHAPQHRADQARVFAARRDGGEAQEITRLESLDFPGLNAEGVWYPWQGGLWLAPYDGSPPRQIAPLPDLRGAASLPELSPWGEGKWVRPAPDGRRIAYACGAELCLQDRDGGNRTRVGVMAREVSWSPDGVRLAAVAWGSKNEEPAHLSLIRRDGSVEREWAIAPDGPVDVPQWTPDGRRIFIQTFPFGGRRILTVDVASGEVLDLSRPRWDAWFALTPDGTGMLLSNGRGGFWLSKVLPSD